MSSSQRLNSILIICFYFITQAPIGVGFSYCSKQVEGEACKNTDRFTASTSRAALVDFFTNKFPKFAKNEFFITGESYAGVYIVSLLYSLFLAVHLCMTRLYLSRMTQFI